MGNKLIIDVHGWKQIEFEEGFLTGPMKNSGISVHPFPGYGGCFDRKDAKRLYDFLGECLTLWNKENS